MTSRKKPELEIFPENKTAEEILRKQANILMKAGRTDEAKKLFDQARAIRLKSSKGSKEWENQFGNFRRRIFSPALKDTENDIRILSATTGTWELLLNKKVMRTIRGVRFSIGFLAENDERIAPRYRDKGLEIVEDEQLYYSGLYTTGSLAPELDKRKANMLTKGLKELQDELHMLETFRELSTPTEVMNTRLGATFFDKIDDKDHILDTLRMKMDNSPAGQVEFADANINDLFNSEAILSSTTNTLIKGVRVLMANDRSSRIISSYGSGGSGFKR